MLTCSLVNPRLTSSFTSDSENLSVGNTVTAGSVLGLTDRDDDGAVKSKNNDLL